LQLPKRSSYLQRKQRGLRAGLLFLLGSALLVGIWALAAPRSFFDDFPSLGMHWVKPLPKYNEHLIRDVGALNLGFALLFAWAVVTLDRRIIQASCLGYLVYSIPHFLFHVFHLETLDTNEAILQTAALGALVLVPIVLFVRASRQDRWAIKNTGRWSGR
jgi:hypothetical protein